MAASENIFASAVRHRARQIAQALRAASSSSGVGCMPSLSAMQYRSSRKARIGNFFRSETLFFKAEKWGANG